MCLQHSSKTLKEWKEKNKNKQYVYVYKIMIPSKNRKKVRSRIYSKKLWKAGIHEEIPSKLLKGYTSNGLYVYLNKPYYFDKESLTVRFIAKPKDIIYISKNQNQAIFKRLHLTQNAIDNAYKNNENKRNRL